jgi:hypothetical protein
MVRMLVQAGANVDACTATEGVPALAHALFSSKQQPQDTEFVQILIGKTGVTNCVTDCYLCWKPMPISPCA